MKRSIPAQPRFKHTYYKNLGGADFSRDRTEVGKKHSPNILNLISDNGGNPVKRLGWRKIHSLGCGAISEMIMHTETVNGSEIPVLYAATQTGLISCLTYPNGTKDVLRITPETTLKSVVFLFTRNMYMPSSMESSTG